MSNLYKCTQCGCAMEPPITERSDVRIANAIAVAVNVADSYGTLDGSHHKMWVIDQMVRTLLGGDYQKFVDARKADGYDWDVGIPP